MKCVNRKADEWHPFKGLTVEAHRQTRQQVRAEFFRIGWKEINDDAVIRLRSRSERRSIARLEQKRLWNGGRWSA